MPPGGAQPSETVELGSEFEAEETQQRPQSVGGLGRGSQGQGVPQGSGSLRRSLGAPG